MTSKKVTDEMLEKYGYKCFYCEHPVEKVRVANKTRGVRKATIDHVIPKIKGGSNKRENLVIACKNCNTKKGAMDKEEFTKPTDGKGIGDV